MLSGNKLLEAYFHKHLPDRRFFSSYPAPTFHTLCQKCVRCLGTCWLSSESVTYTVSWPQLAHKTQANCHIIVSKGNHFIILMVSTAAWNGCSRDMASKRALKCVWDFLFLFSRGAIEDRNALCHLCRTRVHTPINANTPIHSFTISRNSLWSAP